MSPSEDMQTFRTALHNSKNIVAIAGAGLSAASGIPTYRGAGGVWRIHNAMELATPEAFDKNPSRVWQFYHMRREAAMRAEPNPAHLALASLCFPDILAETLPNAKFTLITQNVDGLSTRALQKVPRPPGAQGPSRVFEMHGRLLETLCTVCEAREPNFDSPICEGLRGTERLDGDESIIPEENLPRCRDCDGLLRPGVVWFGETPLDLAEIDEIVEEADLALVVGTSSTVYPAAGYSAQIADNGGKVAVFNLEESRGDEEADWLFLGPCEETLPQALFGAGDPGI